VYGGDARFVLHQPWAATSQQQRSSLFDLKLSSADPDPSGVSTGHLAFKVV